MNQVDIILATYNGEDYLNEQIDSILSQTHNNFRLLIRDDGSTDRTPTIIDRYVCSDERVIKVTDHDISNGVGENFKKLLKLCNSEYVVISDQDDVWLHNKVEILLKYAKKYFNNTVPMLVYSKGTVTDSNLKSLGYYINDKNNISNVSDLLCKNGGVQGCSMLINRSLYSLSLNYNNFWYMHDQVLTFFCAAFGDIHYIDESLFLYRQHESNVLGHKKLSIRNLFSNYFFNSKKTCLINDTSFRFITNWFYSVLDNISRRDRDIIKSFLFECQKNKKISFLFFIILNKIRIQGSVLRACTKLMLVNQIVK